MGRIVVGMDSSAEAAAQQCVHHAACPVVVVRLKDEAVSDA